MNWAIKVKDNNRGGEFLAGKFLIEPGMSLPESLSGYKNAVYSTRASARVAAKSISRPGIRASVVPVMVSVQEVE